MCRHFIPDTTVSEYPEDTPILERTVLESGRRACVLCGPFPGTDDCNSYSSPSSRVEGEVVTFVTQDLTYSLNTFPWGFGSRV